MAYGEAIPAIVSFNAKGEIKPLYFMVDGVQLKVTRAKVTGTVVGHTEFSCFGDDGGIEKPLKVGYVAGEQKWKRII